MFSLVIGIASAGRRAVLSEALNEISLQSRMPDAVFVCPAEPSDFDQDIVQTLPYKVIVLDCVRGLTSQRNTILNAASNAELLVFFDDDFFPHPTYLSQAEYLFRSHSEVIAASGWLIADDIKGPGMKSATAKALIADFDVTLLSSRISEQYNAYGCNMCLRLKTVKTANITFDENLPLYGWLEDVDFCRRISAFGRIIKFDGLVGVHLGTKSGRSSGLIFGYSQVANPLYIWQKGAASLSWALYHIAKNILANIKHFWRPEPWIDRRGRLRGNFLAIADFFRREIHPRRILELNA